MLKQTPIRHRQIIQFAYHTVQSKTTNILNNITYIVAILLKYTLYIFTKRRSFSPILCMDYTYESRQLEQSHRGIVYGWHVLKTARLGSALLCFALMFVCVCVSFFLMNIRYYFYLIDKTVPLVRTLNTHPQRLFGVLRANQ